MLLSELSQGGAPVEITALAYDSRAVGPGTLFFCVTGARSAATTRCRGCSPRRERARRRRALSLGVPELRVASVREAMAPLARALLRRSKRRAARHRDHGTNGKTTTAFLTRQILQTAGEHAALLGTVKSVIGGLDGG